jgi:hypothetical protein
MILVPRQPEQPVEGASAMITNGVMAADTRTLAETNRKEAVEQKNEQMWDALYADSPEGAAIAELSRRHRELAATGDCRPFTDALVEVQGYWESVEVGIADKEVAGLWVNDRATAYALLEALQEKVA